MLRHRKVSSNYRELFVARYDQLLAWALQLAQGDRALAEDLLHDLYVLFNIHEPEITQVLRSSRKAVDDRLRIARSEAKTYLDDPQSLSFVGGLNLPEVFPANFARTSADLLGELRQMIFSSRQGECLGSDHLQSFYQVNEATAMDCAELAHLASCAVCLDEVYPMLI